MAFNDIAARMKEAKQKKASDGKEDTPFDFNQSYLLRGKMLGVLIRDARMNAARSIDDCARLLRVVPQTIESWEYGDQVPSLPQLELLAYYLDIPVSHFWSQNTLEKEREVSVDVQSEYLALRQRMIGALLRHAREEQGLNIDELSDTSNIPVEYLEQYEAGEIAVPMHELVVLSNAVNKNMDYFLDASSHIGVLLQMRQEWQKFASLDEDVRDFVANPINIGFMQIAMMFSKMPTEQLRLVAEGMLEITM